MDDYSARKLSEQLLGKKLGDWCIQKYINHGKSAVVFLGSDGIKDAALKVFDPEIVDRYGRAVQQKRVERELSLIGRSHPNLVSVYGGGEEGNFLFIAMEFFQGSNLAEKLLEVPSSEVRPIISQIASGAKYLEDVSFAHRDIKPENIGISEDMKHAKLLDFGVLRPFDLSSITDQGDQLHFVGTLQYSPPELLFREEEQSIEAWRAITFYQLGAVLHDLLMRKPLFCEFRTPYARLVRAVEREIPLINDPSADSDLRLLSQNCLAKSPLHRLDTVKWEDFSQSKTDDSLEAARRRIAQHRLASAQRQEAPTSREDLHKAQVFSLSSSIFSSVVETTKVESLPRYSIKIISEPHPYLLRVLFEPSEKDGLHHFFALYCKGEVLDPVANLTELRIWACIGVGKGTFPDEPELCVHHKITKGAFIAQDIRIQIQESLLIAYAEALDTETDCDETVNWLSLGV